MSVSKTLQIAASPARVWQLLDDPDQLPLWLPEVVETTYPNGRPKSRGVGVKFMQTVNQRGEIKTYHGEVTAFEHGRQLGIRLTDDSMTIEALYQIARDGSGTRLDFTGDVKARSPLMNMMMMVAWPMSRAIMLQQIQRLKDVAEASVAPAQDVKKAVKPAAATSRKAKVQPKAKGKPKAVVAAAPAPKKQTKSRKAK
jgi:uncharacterized protein YndB with AHSA1/START domain